MIKRKIVYCGLDTETFLLLNKEDEFSLLAVNSIDNYLKFTLNPFNLLFRAIYWLRLKNKLRYLEKFLLWQWKIFKNLSTSVYKRYRDYLELISEENITVLDFDNENLVEKFIKESEMDLLVVNCWGLLPQSIINAPKYGTINIHPSKLPQYRGALPTLWSLKNHDKESAVSYITLNDKADGGSVIAQHPFQISEKDNWLILEVKIKKIISDTLIPDIKGYMEGKIIPQSQDESSLSITGKYDEYKLIDWNKESGWDIYNKINLYPYSDPRVYCYFFLDGRRIEIRKAEFIRDQKIQPGLKIGQFKVKNLQVFIQAKDGIIKSRLFKDIDAASSIKLFFARFGNT
jgi:methionyl-tRNA formyltransferase